MSATSTTCRREILQAAQAVTLRSGRPEFSIVQVVDEMHMRGTRYTDSTIRTHISSRMCTDAPGHHGVVYDDLERLGRGLYRVRIPRGQRSVGGISGESTDEPTGGGPTS